MSADFVANMEDVLDLYAEPYDSQRPVVCFDETSTQLLAETRSALPAQPGRPRRQDYECRREGTRNLFLACEPLAGRRRCTRPFQRQRPGGLQSAAGVPLHPQARQLVEPRIKYGAGYGRNRVQRALPLLPEAAAPRRGDPREGSPGPGAGTQRRPIRHQLAVQYPRCPNQTPPPLPLRFQT